MATVVSGDLRICKPNFAPGFPSPEEQSECRSRLLRKIHALYLTATKRLGRRRLEAAAAGRSVICGGLCFGFLDPVSNIDVNTLVSGKKNERMRPERDLEDLKRRSLDAMVAFLTRLFPDLAECQALRYLRLAGADLLVAARIVASDVGMKRFDSSRSIPAATEALAMAFKCAALAAAGDHPDRLVDGWHMISSRVDEVLRLLGLLRGGAFRSSGIGKLARLLRRPPPVDDGGRHRDLWWAWQLAACRHVRPCNVPFRHTTLLTRTLQDAIHGFYLQALARLPAGELRSCFHRSLLKAGHCYGPFDPVSNIIVNTIWHDAAFPRAHKLDMDVIGTMSLHRKENRSLYGMASFLCTRYHGGDFHQAVCCLLQADANLLLADRNLDPEGTMASVYGMRGGGVLEAADPNLLHDRDNQGPDTGVQEAFLAAARAAQHPNPDAQVKLLTSCNAMLGPAALSLLQGGGKLSSEDVQRIAVLLCPESPRETKRLLPLPLAGYPRVEVADLHARISRKVRDVLNTYKQMPNGDPSFELHTICGVNDYVSGHGGPSSQVLPPLTHQLCGYSQMPFWWWSFSAFLEISTDSYNGRSFCCPVTLPLPCAAQTWCLYCEFMGIRIVHPVGIYFHGRELEFEKMACGEDICGDDLVSTLTQPFYNNLKIINNRCLMADNVRGRVKEDSLYDDVDGQKSEDSEFQEYQCC